MKRYFQLGFAGRRYLLFLVPATLGALTDTLLAVFGSLLAGNLFGEDALRVITLCVPVQSAIRFGTYIFATGAAVMISHAKGAGREDEAYGIFCFGILAVVVTGLLITAGVIVFLQPIAEALGATGELLKPTCDFLFYYSAFTLFHMFSSYFFMQVYNEGEIRRLALAESVQMVGIVGFSILFCQFTPMGLGGLGLAMSLAAFLNAVISGSYYLLRVHRRQFQWPMHLFSPLFRMVKYSICTGSGYIYFAAFIFLMNHFIIRRLGFSFLSVGMLIGLFIQVVAIIGENCLGQALLPLIGSYHGENNPLGLKSTMRTALWMALAIGILTQFLFFAGAPILPQLFGIMEPNMIKESILAVRILSFKAWLMLVNILFIAYYIYLGRVTFSFWLTTLHSLVLPIAGLWLGGRLLGAPGMWGGLVASEVAMWLIIVVSAAVSNRAGGKRLSGVLLLDRARLTHMAVLYLRISRESLKTALDWLEQQLIERGYTSRDGKRARLLLEEEGLLLLQDGRKAEMEITLDFNSPGKMTLRKADPNYNPLLSRKTTGTTDDFSANILSMHGNGFYGSIMGYSKTVYALDKPAPDSEVTRVWETTGDVKHE